MKALNQRIAFEKKRLKQGDFASIYEEGILEGLLIAKELVDKHDR